MLRRAGIVAGLALVVYVPGPALTEEPIRTVRQASLYADVKARPVGDIVTVAIVERASGSNTSRLTTRKNTAFNNKAAEGTGIFSFFPEFGMSAEMGHDHDGSGQLSREGRLTATMAAVVVEVRPNGDLAIAGEREVGINEEVEILKLMHSCDDYSVTFAKGMVLKTSAGRRAKTNGVKTPWTRADEKKSDLLNRLREAEQQQDFYSGLYRQYTTNLLKLVIYVRSWLSSEAVRQYLAANHPDQLKLFDEIINSTER